MVVLASLGTLDVADLAEAARAGHDPGADDHRERRHTHDTPPKSRAYWSRRLAMISQYFSSISTPMHFRPRLRAATKVEPEPANGSAITPGGQRSISISINPTGLGVGCPILATSSDRASAVAITERSGGEDLRHPLPAM